MYVIFILRLVFLMFSSTYPHKKSGRPAIKGSVPFFLECEKFRIHRTGLVIICLVSLMCPHVNAWPSDCGEKTRTQASAGTAVTHAAPIAPAIPPTIPIVPETQPTLAQKSGNIAGSIGGRTVGGSGRTQEPMPGMEPERMAEHIEGAFGFELGERYSGEKKAVVPAEVKNFWNDYLKGKWWYQVQPTTPNRLFTDYYLLLTPKSSSIVGILAVRDYAQVWSEQSGIESDLRECLQDRDAVFAILKRKYYSELSTPKLESRLRHRGGEPLGIFSIEQNGGDEMTQRWVSVHCNGVVDRRPASFGKHLRLTVVYGDLEMNTVLNREVGEYVLESNDPSGF